mgnify:CR=1 FL=1|jgi:hypothetical protein
MKDTNAESIVNTLRTYWKVFNETQEFTEEKFSQLAVAPFIFATSRNNTFILPTLRHIAQFFHVSYTEVYPNLCQPHTFVHYRVSRLHFEQLTENMGLVAQEYVQYTTPGETPRYREGMIILMKKNTIHDIWHMGGLIELDADKYPEDWMSLPVPPNWQYDDEVPREKLRINKVPSGLSQSMFASDLEALF